MAKIIEEDGIQYIVEEVNGVEYKYPYTPPEPTPEPSPSAEERIAQLEAELAESRRENLTAMEAIAELYVLFLGAG
ncbi:hypothetical protein EBB07_33725 [Paenibacillaceae bacterium]|nr:hypothetical protein EBB07_33725 [Paenibacillaceae bacterium]